MISSISWDEDYLQRSSPQIFTSYLQEAVPVLKFINWQVIETREGFAKSLLPLNYESTNQHCTHQAALIAIAADYTGGIAVSTLLFGVPIIGVHPQTTDNGASLWLVSIDIQYKIPSAGDLTVWASIPEKEFDRIRQRYNNGQLLIENVQIHFECEGEEIATANLKYFLRQSRYLKPQSPKGRINALFGHKVKASARLIAGLRATENNEPSPQYLDKLSELAAGTHGKVLTDRFMKVLPQLRDMVISRTVSIDQLILSVIEEHFKQIVFIGVGFDFRCFRLIDRKEDVKVYELDLPYMLVEREKILSRVDSLQILKRELVGINLELEDLHQSLIDHNFDPTLPSIFIMEGVSMYLDDKTNKTIFSALQKLMQHQKSKLWVDIVDRHIIDRNSAFESVENFLKSMEQIGEPFIFGLTEPEVFFEKAGLNILSVTPSNFYKPGLNNPIFGLYHFFLLSNSDFSPKASLTEKENLNFVEDMNNYIET